MFLGNITFDSCNAYVEAVCLDLDIDCLVTGFSALDIDLMFSEQLNDTRLFEIFFLKRERRR